MDFSTYLLGALALALIMEGLVYALFPDQLRKMMAIILTLPAGRLRVAGLSIAAAGCVILWLAERYAGLQ